MRLSTYTRASEVSSIQKATTKATSFGKAWDVGDNILVVLPIHRVVNVNPYSGREEVVYEPVLASVFGHRVDSKKIEGIGSFVPSLVDYDSDYRPIRPAKGEDGKPVFNEDGSIMWERCEPDFLGRMSPIIRVLHNAEHKKALDDIAHKKAPGSAKQDLTEKENKEFKESSPALSRVRLYASTEVIACKLVSGKINITDENRPQFYSLEWKGKVASQIGSILRSVDSRPTFEEEFGYIALTFSYPQKANKALSGGDVSIRVNAGPNSVMELCPDEWKEVLSMVDSLPKTAEEIGRRAWAYQEQSEAKIKKAIMDYLAKNVEFLESLESEDDDMKTLVRHGADLIECVGREYLADQVLAAIDEAMAKDKAEEEVEAAKEAEELRTHEEAAPSMQQLMEAGEANSDEDEITLPD